ALGGPDRADHDDLLRHRADDRPEGIRRRDPRWNGELPAGGARRARRRAARVVLVVLGERTEGNHRLHDHHPGTRLAFAHVAAPRRGRGGMMRVQWPAQWPVFAFALFIAVAPWLVPAFYITLMNYIGLATLVVLGLVLLTGIAGIVSFGQQAFVGIAAYTTALLSTAMGMSPWLTLLASLAVVGAFGLLLGAITLRLSGHYLSIATIAWGIAIYYVFGNLPGLGHFSGIDNVPPIELLGWTLDSGPRIYYLIWAVAVLAIVAALNLLDSRAGRALRALRFRAVMAESFGVDTARLKVLVFLYAALLAGVSGWLHAHFLRFVSPHAFAVHAGIDYLFMAVIGGASQVWGAVIGASVLTLLREWLKDLLPVAIQRTGNYEIVVFGVLMLLLLQRTRNGIAPAIGRWLPKGRPRPPSADA